MMRQYLAIREAHKGYLLFYRMGDFYELFFDDAVRAAEALDIALTKRGQHLGEDIPMCGVPVHSAEGYLQRLIAKGFRVAIAEQTEDPAEAKKRGAKSVVAREVVRIVTPGTITEEGLLEARTCNYLAAVALAPSSAALAWLELSTGEFRVLDTTPALLAAELTRIGPSEVLLPERFAQAGAYDEVFGTWKEQLTVRPDTCFSARKGGDALRQSFRLATLDSLGPLSDSVLAACGALLDYVHLTQKGQLPCLQRPKLGNTSDHVAMDAATRRNLELQASSAGERKGSLLWAIDRSVTSAGGRMLAGWLAAPLTNPDAIQARLDGVEHFMTAREFRVSLRQHLKRMPDLERSLSRLALGRGSPRDLGVIRDGLAAVREVLALFYQAQMPNPPAIVGEALASLRDHDALIEKLQQALVAEPGLLARDGGFIADGFCPTLDEFRGLARESKRHIAALQEKYGKETGIPSLKIRHNHVIGYHIEITVAHKDKVPEHFFHRQTMAGALRYATTELNELEGKIASAGAKALELEAQYFAELTHEVLEKSDAVGKAAVGIATLDAVAGLAELAEERRYCRPIVEEGLAFDIREGRHPVVEAMLSEPFISNDCRLEDGRLWLLTGPNMAGKSTFLRQNALIALMAQMGSFVPAASARIGVIDRLFSRVGAADDLARGRSTFMVEMVETAAILHQATERSLVILDEIGRGTATFDGLSIAWAVLEYLHDACRCRGLFATHYHELTKLSARLAHLACHTMQVKEWKGDVVFLHAVIPGAADRSYGIHVARLAGLPDAVTSRADTILKELEAEGQQGRLSRLADDLPLFAMNPSAPAAPAKPSAAEEALRSIDPDSLSPREALDALYRLKAFL
ncbi:MAG: DNA mismatch repair protein MutS [Alphaproteobacteria bacterium]|nr:DNA mismatch repair protein MutS [Alphaproteobacteria bacterium]